MSVILFFILHGSVEHAVLVVSFRVSKVADNIYPALYKKKIQTVVSIKFAYCKCTHGTKLKVELVWFVLR